MGRNCNNTGLAVYSGTSWTAAEIKHLYRRAAFGIAPSEISADLVKTPETVVDELIDDALAMAPTAPPSWAYDYTESSLFNNELLKAWRYTMLTELKQNKLRDRLMLFWSNHFVTEYQAYGCRSYLYDYITTLQRNCLGNFKTFVHEIGLLPSMLVYLNGKDNRKGRPNENYARELYELFTLGEGIGYDQTDIEETAKALTGYTFRPDRCAPFEFQSDKFDSSEKTIFGRTGNWGYDDVIDILFEERPDEIARFVVEKIYRHFVHPVLPETDLIDILVSNFIASGFELAPLFRTLFKSEHFFDTTVREVIIKSPLDLMISFYNDTDMPFPRQGDDYVADALFFWGAEMGQRLFDPPNVAGWQGDREWINSSLLLSRWKNMEKIVKSLYYNYDKEQFRNLAVTIVDDVAETDVQIICRKIVENFLPTSLLSGLEYDNALETFKSNVPENYFEDGTWSLMYPSVPEQVKDLLLFIITQPEFQLK